MVEPETIDWQDGCDRVVNGTQPGELFANCSKQLHSEAAILARWRGSLNGHAAPKRDRWLTGLSEYLKNKLNSENEHRQNGVDRNLFREWMFGDLQSLPQREAWAFPPVELTSEDIDAALWAMIDFYLPAEKEPPKPKSKITDLTSADDYLVEYAERAARPFIWEEMLYAGSFNLLLGRAFSGKSSLSAALVRAIVMELPFLGRRTRKVRCAYLALERNGAAVATLFQKWGISKNVLFKDEIAAQDAALFIRAQIEKLKIEFLVIDHIQHAACIMMGNDYADVSNALMPYQAMARDFACCIFGLHHQGKPKLEQNESADETLIDALGSEAYRASSDTMLEATTYRGQYFLRAQPRAGTDLDRTLVDIDFETGEVTGTDTEEADVRVMVQRIQELLNQKPGQTETDIRRQVHGKGAVVNKALKQGCDQRLIVRSGEGGKGHPFLYFLRFPEDSNGNGDDF